MVFFNFAKSELLLSLVAQVLLAGNAFILPYTNSELDVADYLQLVALATPAALLLSFKLDYLILSKEESGSIFKFFVFFYLGVVLLVGIGFYYVFRSYILLGSFGLMVSSMVYAYLLRMNRRRLIYILQISQVVIFLLVVLTHSVSLEISFLLSKSVVPVLFLIVFVGLKDLNQFLLWVLIGVRFSNFVPLLCDFVNRRLMRNFQFTLFDALTLLNASLVIFVFERLGMSEELNFYYYSHRIIGILAIMGLPYLVNRIKSGYKYSFTWRLLVLSLCVIIGILVWIGLAQVYKPLQIDSLLFIVIGGFASLVVILNQLINSYKFEWYQSDSLGLFSLVGYITLLSLSYLLLIYLMGLSPLVIYIGLIPGLWLLLRLRSWFIGSSHINRTE